MKKATEVMYKLGKIFNLIGLIFGLIFVVLGIILIIVGAIDTNEALLASGGSLLGTGLYLVIVEIVVLIFVGKALKSIESGSKEKAPHIIMIVLGAIGDIFFLLGGIFGLVTLAQEEGE